MGDSRSAVGWTLSRSVALGLLIFASAVSAAPVQAQGQPHRVTLGLDAGVFIDYPSEFNGPFCEQRAAGLSGKGSYWLTRYLAVEGSSTLAFGIGDQECYLALSPPPPVGSRFTRFVRDDHVIGTSFFAANIAATLEAPLDFPVRPRARLGAGWLLGKSMPMWFVGGGFRFQFGSHAMIMDVERWQLRFDLVQELVLHQSIGTYQVLSTDLITESVSPYLVRMGWEVAVR